jgi:hypothetical protein
MIIWKDVVGYEGLYQVSNDGQVKSLFRYVNCRGGHRSVRERILRCTQTNLGYQQVVLCKDLTYKKLSIHRLVAQAFIPNPHNLPCINHIDADPTNNHVENLEWCTHGYNSNYYICKERQRLRMLDRYEQDPEFLSRCRARLDAWHKISSKKVCQIDLMGNLVKVWDSVQATAQDCFLPSNVSHCANHKRKTHHGFTWVWLDEYEKR